MSATNESINAPQTETQGTAMKSVYNPSAFMWALLIGIPAALFFVVMLKFTQG